jgi:addiction module HigA family antidote
MSERTIETDHPGKTLEQMITDKNLVRSKLAMEIGIYPTQITDIVKGRKDISPAIAVKFEKAFDKPAEYWLELQMKYDLATERAKAL